MAMRRVSLEAPSVRSPATQRCHLGLDPCLVDEDEAAWIDAGLVRPPALPLASDVRPALFGRQHGFFEAQPLRM